MKKEVSLPSETVPIKKRPKIYYASGMISLLVIPLLGLHLITKRLDHTRCLEVLFCNKDTTCNLCIKCFPPKRIYKQINFTGNSLMEKKTLHMIDSMANILFMKGDTIHGLEVNLNYQSTYKTLIRLLDICKHRRMPVYWLNEDQFLICFDDDYLKTDDRSFKTKLISRNKHLLETKHDDDVRPIKLEPNFAVTDMIVSVDSEPTQYEMDERNKNFLDFVNQRKVLIGLWAIVYMAMIVLTIRRLGRLFGKAEHSRQASRR